MDGVNTHFQNNNFFFIHKYKITNFGMILLFWKCYYGNDCTRFHPRKYFKSHRNHKKRQNKRKKKKRKKKKKQQPEAEFIQYIPPTPIVLNEQCPRFQPNASPSCLFGVGCPYKHEKKDCDSFLRHGSCKYK